MADSKGFYDKEDLIPFLIEGSNWTWFKKILALCIEEGKPGHFLDIGAGLGFFVEMLSCGTSVVNSSIDSQFIESIPVLKTSKLLVCFAMNSRSRIPGCWDIRIATI